MSASEHIVHSSTPSWVLYVVRFKNQITADISKIKRLESHNISIDKPLDYVFEELPPLIIDEDCIDLTTSSSKGSHVHALQATLLPTRNYLREIRPGDWVFAWMHDDPTRISYVTKLLREGKKANHRQSGLKFVGKVSGMRKSVTISPNGAKRTNYLLTGHAFTEFNNQLYYFPQMSRSKEAAEMASEWTIKLGAYINDLLTHPKKDGVGTEASGIVSHKIIPRLLDITLGKGLPSDLKVAESAPHSPNTEVPCRIPNSAGTVLGLDALQTWSGPNYRDILEVVIGSIKAAPYGSDSSQTNEDGSLSVAFAGTSIDVVRPGGFKLVVKNPFISSTTRELNTSVGAKQHDCDGKLIGKFPLTPPTLQFTPVWQLITSYLNGAVNEAYTTLRASNDRDDDSIYPCFIARQKPFNTLAGIEAFGILEESDSRFFDHIHVASMEEITTWEIPDSIVLGYDVGSSDTTRVNYISTGGVQERSKSNPSLGLVFVNGGITWDKLDAARNGIHSITQNVNCVAADNVHGPIIWNKLLSDYYSGLFLTYSGTMNCIGIAQPICIGDNISFNDIVYQIESINHRCSRAPDGKTSFTTNFSFTHGMVKEQLVEDFAKLDSTNYHDTHPSPLTNNPEDPYAIPEAAPRSTPKTPQESILFKRTNQYPVSTSIHIKEIDEGQVSAFPFPDRSF